MKLLFKQRAFAWFDSYDIYDENENTVYIVKGQLSWGHCLKIFDASEENELGTVKEQIFSWWPQFELYEGSDCIGIFFAPGGIALDGAVVVVGKFFVRKGAYFHA